MKQVVLASTSPYRKALMLRLGIPFVTARPEVDEEAYKARIADPVALVQALSRAKAEAVAAAHPGAVVLIGSAPTALELLLERVAAGALAAPALVIGMPVGFVGVAESKRHLAASDLPQIRLEGSRGGAGLVAAAVNALLRRAWLDRQGDLPSV